MSYLTELGWATYIQIRSSPLNNWALRAIQKRKDTKEQKKSSSFPNGPVEKRRFLFSSTSTSSRENFLIGLIGTNHTNERQGRAAAAAAAGLLVFALD